MQVATEEKKGYNKEYAKAYYRTNYETIRKRLNDRYRSNKVVCGCGGKASKIDIYKGAHEASKKHQKWLKSRALVDANTQGEISAEARSLDEFIFVADGNQSTVESSDSSAPGSV